ncbi:trehalose-phosphatase [Mycobacterium sp. E2479]|uniref:trehalose-phosphatase n=1 Tax=Mycobacterium sp. E2479 TaxID=1834134 RepID=UPI001E60719A|nr:trehalose-phosphatase [Mycobacterium sp. E2479]
MISGRDLLDVRTRANVEGIWYAGSHGLELQEPDGTHHENTSATELVDALALAATRLAGMSKDIPGIAVEHKRFAVAIHYRNANAGKPPSGDRDSPFIRSLRGPPLQPGPQSHRASPKHRLE